MVFHHGGAPAASATPPASSTASGDPQIPSGIFPVPSGVPYQLLFKFILTPGSINHLESNFIPTLGNVDHNMLHTKT
ncbi:hypothetical protein F8M41_013843 [Gigaspora margarita]|uniref:Uncharacterized protein n=1 Tax=Gigaspora margarita TaxID=4874 RepID=A0A8H4EP68_GIGMA|nr:hypothetical protein F8M41_013843 [Gigaspora margarita]